MTERWAALASDVLDALEAALFDAPHCGHRHCPEALLLAVRVLCLWAELRCGAAAGIRRPLTFLLRPLCAAVHCCAFVRPWFVWHPAIGGFSLYLLCFLLSQ